MGTRSKLGSAELVSTVVSFALLSTEPAAGQVTHRLSIDSGGMQGDNESFDASISADGRYVAFLSFATNLVGGDTNDTWDIFVHDRDTATTERVSVDSSGTQGNGGSLAPAISADGRYVVFYSAASNLVGGDTNSATDVFVHDRQSGTTECVSVDSLGNQANGGSESASISADGHHVAFYSYATNLVAGDTNGDRDIFVRDRQNGVTERVSVDSSGTEGNGWSYAPVISADGRYVAFPSDSSNLVSGDTNGRLDIFVHDRQSGVTERVSVSTSGAEANDHCMSTSISFDGRYVAFSGRASNLVDGDTNLRDDVFVRDRLNDTTERVSINSLGDQANFDSGSPSISADGRYVAFHSGASNLYGADHNGSADVFLHDRDAGTTECISVTPNHDVGWSGSDFPSVSSDGRYVAFESGAHDLIFGDTDWNTDVFVRDRNVFGTKYCSANANSTGWPAELWASGSSSSSAGDLQLSAVPVPSQPGLFFHGANQVQIPFGNGFLCTSGGIVRGAVVQPVFEFVNYRYDNSSPKRSLAAFVNTTRNFQYWFRDPMTGAAFNTSNAISMLILP